MLQRTPSQQPLVKPALPYSSKTINNSLWMKFIHFLLTLAFFALAVGVIYISLHLGRVFIKKEEDYDPPMRTEMPLPKLQTDSPS